MTTAEVWACVALLQADPRWQNAQLDPLTLASEDKRVVFRDAWSGRVHEFRDAQDLREWVGRMTKGGGTHEAAGGVRGGAEPGRGVCGCGGLGGVADGPDGRMSAFQREVGAWAQQTFPQSTRESVLAHLYDELQELMAADQGEQAEGHTEIEEAADCYLLLLHYAHKCRFDLEESAMLKHLRNMRRQWGVPDERGVVRHVVEGIQA